MLFLGYLVLDLDRSDLHILFVQIQLIQQGGITNRLIFNRLFAK